jgi:glycerol 3-phosphatase-2
VPEPPLVAAYDVLLCDLDGVVYRGREPVPHAAEALTAASESGVRAVYVTNNASRRPDDVVEQLAGYGLRAEDRDVITSSQATGHVLEERLPAGSKVLVLGAPALREAVTGAGMRIVDSADSDPAAVVQGYNRELAYPMLAEAALAIRAGALWVATNTDATFPSDRGLLPGNGALVAALRTATDAEPLVIGKPEPALLTEAVRRTGADRPLFVGDRLDTDVAGAVRAGIDSLLVLTGTVGPAQALHAPPGQRPTHVGLDLRTLQRPATGSAGWRVEVAGDELRIAANGADPHPEDALRALCRAAWSTSDESTSERSTSEQFSSDHRWRVVPRDEQAERAVEALGLGERQPSEQR